MRFRLLGPLEVTEGGDPLALGGPKQRLVLAHLLIRANQVVSADLLIDEIWGEEPPDAARASLHSYVSHLRTSLGADRLVGRAPGYILRVSAEEIDATRFEALVTRARRSLNADPATAARLLHDALSLWHGDALADLAYEPSLQFEIERLTEMRLGAVEARIDADMALGRHGEVTGELERLVSAHPLRERPSVQLMLALYRAGRQAEALAAYHRLRSALDTELGVDPSPAVERLQSQILNHDPELELRGAPLRGYRLIERIGSGRYGTVHRALEPQAEREVAIKVLGAEAANQQDFIRRFDGEARRVARLEHPHIVPLYDWWREPDAAYLVMRLMRGGSLAQRLDGGQVGLTDALRWAEQVGSALATAHRHGVAHGDVRPSNVLLDADANAYLGDFVAVTDAAGDGAAEPSGSAAYLAPERRAGGGPSAPADIYAFGVLLGELLDHAIAVADGGVARSTLEAATSGDIAARPSSAHELADAFRQALHAPTGTAPGTEQVSRQERNPYKGLRAFEEGDATDFFGREALVAQLVARMSEAAEAARLLAVVGPSGSGKSSVVNAGLLPALRAGAVDGSDRWLVAGMTPGERPFEQLERALLSVAVDAPASLSELTTADDGLRDAIARVLAPAAELLLVIDQFEELFTLVTDDAVRRRFLEVLARTIDDAASRVRIVITLRADFYDRPLRHERFGSLLAARTHAVPPLTPEELERVVTAPAERVGLRPEPGLVARMVAEMSEQAGALPLLQYSLTELWERRDGARLSLRAYDASGGIAAAVGRRAEELVRGLDDDGHEAARQLFLRLVELGEGTPDTARRVLRSELQALASDRGRIDAVIERFARHRLLLFDRDPETREATLELAHEAILRAWPRLQQWVDEARDDLRNQRNLAVAAAQWVDGGRDASFLLTGARLEQTEQWAASTRLMLTEGEGEYLAVSVAERQRIEEAEERRRAHEIALERRAVTRLRALVVALGLGALVAAGLSLIALAESGRAAREARVAGARELAAAAVANLDEDPERSILLALAAIDRTRSDDGSVLREAEEALHRAVVASRAVLTVRGVGGALAWSPDGSVFVTEGPEESGVIDIRDAVTGESVRTWRGHDVDVNDVAFNHDGSMLVTTGDDGAARVWNPSTGELSHIVEGQPDSEVWGPSFSSDGGLAAAAWTDEGVVRVWDSATGAIVREIGPLVGPRRASFSPLEDDARLAVALLWGGHALVVDARTGEELLHLDDGQSTEVTDVAWSTDASWIATGSADITAVVWDALTGDLHDTLHGHTAVVWATAWSPVDPARLMTGSEDGTARLWEITDTGARELLVLSAQDYGGVYGVAFSPDGERIMTGDVGITAVKIWDVGHGGDAEWANRPNMGLPTFTPDSSAVVSARLDGAVVYWDPVSGEDLLAVADRGPPFAPPDSLTTVLAVSPDGALVATGGSDRAVTVWAATTGEDVFRVDHGDWTEDAVWSPDGELLATAGWDGLAKVVDRAGREVAVLVEDPGFAVRAVRFSPDGRLLATTRVETGRPDPLAWQVKLWDWEAGEVVQTLVTEAQFVAFDPTGTRVATSHTSGTPELWEVETGERIASLVGHSGAVMGVEFSPDGSLLATAGLDATVRLWEVESAALALTLRGHTQQIWGVAFSPDGSKLASFSNDGIRVWALDLDDLIGIARGMLTRTLTDEECRQYLHLETCPTG